MKWAVPQSAFLNIFPFLNITRAPTVIGMEGAAFSIFYLKTFVFTYFIILVDWLLTLALAYQLQDKFFFFFHNL